MAGTCHLEDYEDESGASDPVRDALYLPVLAGHLDLGESSQLSRLCSQRGTAKDARSRGFP